MDKNQREYYKKKYKHLNLYFSHGPGWDHLTLTAAQILDSYWPSIPFWMKHLWAYLMGHGVCYRRLGKILCKLRIARYFDKPSFFLQIKEKFGTLRLYCTPSPNSITFLENASCSICEKCGSNRDIGNTEGWIKTLCKECGKDNPTWYPIRIIF